MKARYYILIVAGGIALFLALLYINGIISGIDRQYKKMIQEKEAEIKEMRHEIDSLSSINSELKLSYVELTDSIEIYVARIKYRDKKIEDIKNESSTNYIRINASDLGGIFKLFAGIDTNRIRH